MRIKLPDSSRVELLSKLKNKYGSYAEASRKLHLNYVFLKNWSSKGGFVSKEDFHTILKNLNLSEKSFSFEKFEKPQNFVAKNRFPPNHKMAADLVHQIEEYNGGFSIYKFYKLDPETLLEFNPEIIKILFLAGKYHFGSTAKLSRYLNLNETTCRDYLKKGVKHMQFRRINPLVHLLRDYGLSKIPSLSYEEGKKSLSLDDIKHFIKHGIRCTQKLNPKRIAGTYSRIYAHDSISLLELVGLSDEPVGKFAKVEYTKRAIKHLFRLGLIKRRRDLSKKPIAYKYSSTRRLCPKELEFVIRYNDKISLEKLQKIFDPKLLYEEKDKMIGDIEKFIISEGIFRNFYEKTRVEYSESTFESIVKCIRNMPPPILDEKLETFIKHAYFILECLETRNGSVEVLYKCLERKLHKKVNTLAVLNVLKFYEEIGKIVFDTQSKIYCLKDSLNC